MIEWMVGVNVTNSAGYAEYRAKMTPLLEAMGGRFGIDVEVGRMLRPTSEGSVNRLFMIGFPSQEAFKAFFANEEYLSIREAHFEPSVSNTVIFGRYKVLP